MGWRILVNFIPRVWLHTIYAAKFEQTIIHQHVYLRRESQSYDPGACANEIIPNREIAHLFTKRKKGVMHNVNKCLNKL
jgi:hypothetical protein